MAKAKTYRLWTCRLDYQSHDEAIAEAFAAPHLFVASRDEARRTWPTFEPISVLVRVVPPAKRRARR